MQEFFYIRTNNKYVQIRFSEIIYGEGKRNFVKLICKERNVLFPGMMHELVDALPKNMFCRVHKSFIVAIENVKEFDKEELLLKNGEVIPAGKYYVNDFIERINVIGRGAGNWGKKLKHGSIIPLDDGGLIKKFSHVK